MLILTRKLNESIMIGDQVEITVVDIKGDQVKIGIKAPNQTGGLPRHSAGEYRSGKSQTRLTSPAGQILK